MKKGVFILILFTFVAVFCGNLSSFISKKVDVSALNGSSLETVVEEDIFETIPINKSITRNDLIKKINVKKMRYIN